MGETIYICGYLRNYKSDGMPRKNSKRKVLHICHSEEEARRRLNFDCDFRKYDIRLFSGNWKELSLPEIYQNLNNNFKEEK